MQSHFIGGAQRTVRDLPIQHREVVRNGGERPLDMNGSYAVGQMYAMEYRLARPRSPLPVLLWHGGGMTGAQWESTPDGRQGWLWRLLEAGHDVVVCDAVERGRAGWAMFPEIYAEAPVFRSAEEAWTLAWASPSSASGFHMRILVPWCGRWCRAGWGMRPWPWRPMTRCWSSSAPVW